MNGKASLSPQNDTAIFETLFAEFHRSVYRFAYYLTENRDEADELYQETWLKVVQNLSKIEKVKKQEAWILTITANAHKDRLRKKRIRNIMSFRSFTDPQDEQDILRGRETENVSIQDPDSFELREVLRRAIANLPWKQARVFVLKEIEGFKHHEIAEMLNIPSGTVKSLLHRAVKALRQDLQPYWETET